MTHDTTCKRCGRGARHARHVLIAVALLAGAAAPAMAQSAYDVCRMGIATVQKHREAVAYVRARWERALSRAQDSDAKALAIANMEAWYAENMRSLDAQLRDLQQQCDPGSQVRRGEPVSRVAPVPRPSVPRVRRPLPRRPMPPSGPMRYPPYERTPPPIDPFERR
jgi:hypothetical protein